MKTVDKIYPYGIIPVITLTDSSAAAPLAQALRKGGLPVMEVTFRTGAAAGSIQRIAQAVPEIILGAGTVLSVEQAEQAIRAGAQYIVTPGLNREIAEYCQERQIEVIPGVSTPTEVEEAMGLGLKILKFFPAEAGGGANALHALSGPYADVSFIPTGGINEKNLSGYLKQKNVFACGASYIADKALISQGKFEEIEERARAAVKAAHSFKMTHVGINAKSQEGADEIAEKLCRLFGFEKEAGRISCFAGSEIEVMYDDTYGRNGHLSVTANSIDRAYHYLKEQGVEFLENTIKYNEQGKVRFVYLRDEIGGFAIHLY